MYYVEVCIEYANSFTLIQYDIEHMRSYTITLAKQDQIKLNYIYDLIFCIKFQENSCFQGSSKIY